MRCVENVHMYPYAALTCSACFTQARISCTSDRTAVHSKPTLTRSSVTTTWLHEERVRSEKKGSIRYTYWKLGHVRYTWILSWSHSSEPCTQICVAVTVPRKLHAVISVKLRRVESEVACCMDTGYRMPLFDEHSRVKYLRTL